jgi:hypothetical protein
MEDAGTKDVVWLTKEFITESFSAMSENQKV